MKVKLIKLSDDEFLITIPDKLIKQAGIDPDKEINVNLSAANYRLIISQTKEPLYCARCGLHNEVEPTVIV